MKRSRGFTLSGEKIHCSGAGAVTRALITADQHMDARMLTIALAPGERARPMPHIPARDDSRCRVTRR